MKKHAVEFVSLSFLICFAMSSVSGQSIPGDSVHLPQKIGGEPKTNARVDSVTVSGRIRLEGLPAGNSRPPIYVAAFSQGRLIVRRAVSESGAYSLGDVPREWTTIVVEIENSEVASSQLIPSPASVVYKDFSVNWEKFRGAKDKTGVVSAAVAYERSRPSQERLDRALVAITNQEYDSAIRDLNALITNDPKDFYAWTQLGNAYFLKKEVKAAEDAYKQAIVVGPKFALASINLGKLYLSQNENEKAIELLTKTVESEPLSADANHYLGEAYLAVKKGSKAVGYLNEAIRLAPVEKAEIHLRLGALYHGAGLRSRAAAEYQKFLEKMPKTERRKELEKYIKENPPTQ